VAGRVLCEGRSEVGAARVPAAQGALDVRGAQVVLELGFRQRAQERAAVIAGGEVQERARDRGGPKRPLWVMSLGRSRALSNTSRPGIAPRRRGVASVITEGGAGMMRQRQAAVP